MIVEALGSSLFLPYWILFALLLGSFANVCIHRLPLGQSLVRPRSRCPFCGFFIPWHHNIPLVSFAMLKGRCSSCGKGISWRYPLVELLAALLFAALFLRQGHDLRLMGVGAVLSLYLLIIAFIDIQHQIIPNELSLSLLILGILASPIHPLLGPSPWPRALNALLGGTVGFSLMLSLAYLGEFLWKKEALGGGDIKLMAALGTFLGWRGIFVTLFLGSLFGALWALSMMAFRRMAKGSYLPFGPFLALGAWMCWIFLDRLDEIWPY